MVHALRDPFVSAGSSARSKGRKKGAEIVYDLCACLTQRELSAIVNLSLGPIPLYGFVGITPGLNRSDKSVALAASPKNGDVPPDAFTWKISCMVRKSEEWE